MEKHLADKIITEYVKRLYGFAVSKISDFEESRELAEEIIFQVYTTLLRQDNIANVDGYIYKIAQNTFVRHINKRNRFTAVDGIETMLSEQSADEDIFLSETIGVLRREITYLSETRRKIVILHYFKDKKVRETADELNLPENTVKWHLACLRKELKTGMEKVRTTGTLGTEPIRLTGLGHDGCPGSKGDTADFLAKSLTQNIAYAAYHQPRTINEIAEELGVNPIFVRDEVDVLEEYGFMDKLPTGKYRTNILIKEPSEMMRRIYSEIKPKYAKLFAEKFFAPVLEKITEIPDWIHVPDNDINLLKWSMVCFLAMRLETVQGGNEKFSVKRPDGGDYIAHATLDVKTDWNIKTTDENIYWSCGHMWRKSESEDMYWVNWQLDCHWTDREGLWRNNLSEDYDKMYFWLNGQLSESIATVESYARLLDKGYLVKRDSGYKCNLIVCDSNEKWWSIIPCADEETLALSREYADKTLEAELINLPEHMHELIKHYTRNNACALHTRVMKELLDMGVLKLPTAEQAKGLCTIMFTGE